MGTLEHFLEHYGLVAVFVASMFEGDVTLLLTGLLAHYGVFPFYAGVTAGAAGGLVGDILYFFAGRRLGERWLRSHLAWAEHLVERWWQRWGVRSLFLGRYIYGARIAAMMFWGVRGERFARFVVLDAINCGLWALTFSALGYLFSQGLSTLLSEWRRVEVGLLTGILVFALLALALQLLSRQITRPQKRSQP